MRSLTRMQRVSDIINLSKDASCSAKQTNGKPGHALDVDPFVLQTCLTTHYGLWKGCTKTLWVADIDPEREVCGPAELPGGDSKND